MSGNDHLTGRQLAAGRTLAGVGQEELAKRANISVPTLRRMEASTGAVIGLANNVLAVQAALESAGVIFVPGNGEGPGVRLRKDAAHPDVDAHIETLKSNLPHIDEAAPPSPAKAMRQLERAHGKNEIVKAKGKRDEK